MAGLFQVLKGQPDGSFGKAEVLNGTDGEPLIISVRSRPGEGEDWIKNICTRPFAVDWDGDGHLDLVVGNFPGTFYLFKGEGKGAFRPVPQEMMAGDQPLKIRGAHGDPFVIDWDGDGDLDVLSGSSEGGVQWAENRAGSGKPPELAQFRDLIESGPSADRGRILRDEDIKGPSSSTRVWADDVNSDGKLDLLVGDLATSVSPADGVTEEEFQEKYAAWTRATAGAAEEMNAAADEAKRDEAKRRFQRLQYQPSDFMTEDRTGFVWLYLRK